MGIGRALVTGAGSGIGRATAHVLIRDGWRVVFTGRRLDALREAIDSAGDPHGDIASRALAVPADLTRPDSVAALFDVVRARHGRLDLLFNNAGVFTPGVPLEDLPFEQWKAAVDTNLSGAFLCTQHAFRIMKAQSPKGGRIVNNGSISAHAPRPNSVPYTATKHAITGLTKALARRPPARHRLRPDRHRQRRHRHDRAHGRRRAAGRRQRPRRGAMDVRHVAEAVLTMANLPLDANVLFMTMMATKMPFVGRG
jgi:NAD(P)-dependent dehydrogenase (short-subunit alcohol dehydrogenase family)